MRQRAALMFTAVSTVAACCALAASGGAATAARSAAAPPRAAAAGSSWGKAQVIPGPDSTTGDIDTMSCASPGNCSAGGEYDAGGTGQAFVVTQTKGTWGKAEEVPGTAHLNSGGLALVVAVSCASAGNCTAGGVYSVSSINDEQAFVVTETKGTWGKAEEVPGTAHLNAGDTAGAGTVSCAAPGNCSAGGNYLAASGNFEAWVATEAGGTWGKAEEVPGTASLNTGGNANLESVSCASAGNCSGAGNYSDSPGSGENQSFVVNETSGTWGTAQKVPGLATLSGDGISYLQAVSCGSTGNCGAIGTEWNGTTDIDEAFVVNETSGTWDKAQKVPGVTALGKGVVSWTGPEDCYTGNCASVSCPSAGNCGATGSYQGNTGGTQAFVVNETSGTWGKAEEVPGIATLNTGHDAEFYGVSCGSPGNCSAGGYYGSSENFSSRRQAFVVNETGGTWGKAEEVPGTASLNTADDALAETVSCASASSCAAGGSYSATTGGNAFVVTRPATQAAPRPGRAAPSSAGSWWRPPRTVTAAAPPSQRPGHG